MTYFTTSTDAVTSGEWSGIATAQSRCGRGPSAHGHVQSAAGGWRFRHEFVEGSGPGCRVIYCSVDAGLLVDGRPWVSH